MSTLTPCRRRARIAGNPRACSLGTGRTSGAHCLGEVRQRLCVEVIRFGRLVCGLRDVTRLPRVHCRHGKPGCGEGDDGRVLVAAAGLQDNQRGGHRVKTFKERTVSLVIIGSAQRLPTGSYATSSLPFETSIPTSKVSSRSSFSTYAFCHPLGPSLHMRAPYAPATARALGEDGRGDQDSRTVSTGPRGRRSTAPDVGHTHDVQRPEGAGGGARRRDRH